jgi:hypothetical protein
MMMVEDLAPVCLPHRAGFYNVWRSLQEYAGVVYRKNLQGLNPCGVEIANSNPNLQVIALVSLLDHCRQEKMKDWQIIKHFDRPILSYLFNGFA